MHRRSTIRSKTGCLTCRVRRVKCDETKPCCKRCYIAWQICEYSDPSYGDSSGLQPAQRKNKQVPGQHVFALKPDAPSSSVKSPNPSKSLPSACSQKTLEQVKYFRTVCLASFAGYVDTRSWNSLVLQVADVEPAIQSAVVALASLHRLKSLKDGRQKDPEPFLQYRRAIRVLNKRLDKSVRSQQVALIASILFLIFEQQSGNQEAALMHADGGFAIMKEVINATPGIINTPGTFKDVSLSFLRVDIAFSISDEGYQTKSLRPHLLPEKFYNEFEAFEALYDIVAHVCRLKNAHRHCDCAIPHTKTHHTTNMGVEFIIECLQKWLAIFTAFQLAEIEDMSRRMVQSSHDGMLYKYYLTFVNTTTICGPIQAAQDTFTSHFVQLLQTTNRVLQRNIPITTEKDSQGLAKMIVSSGEDMAAPQTFRMGQNQPEILIDITVALYSTARKFRHRRVRSCVMQMLDCAGLIGAFNNAYTAGKEHDVFGREQMTYEPRQDSLDAFEVAFGELNETIRLRRSIRDSVPDWIPAYFVRYPYPD